MRLIDPIELKRSIVASNIIGDGKTLEELIDEQPDAQPQRMRGRWYRGEAYPHHLYCSLCFRTALPNDEYIERWNLHMNYCPNCGADMREGQE